MITEVKRRNKRKNHQDDFKQIDPVISKGMEGGNYKPLSDNDIKKIYWIWIWLYKKRLVEFLPYYWEKIRGWI